MHRKAFKIAQWLFAILVIGFATKGVIHQWAEVRGRIESLELRWVMIVIASIIVLLVYTLLIETWRKMLAAWDTTLPWLTAARIWFASSLGKYVPGYIWSLTAMGMMAREQGASGIAAAGSSIIVNVLNLASGLAVVLICGSKLIANQTVAFVLLGAVLAAAVAMPYVLPKVAELFCKVTKKEIPIPNIPATTIWFVTLCTGVAWIAYGVAFRFFAEGMLGTSTSMETTLLYIAVYTGAYILGLIAPIAPAGFGVREASMIEGLTLLGVVPHADALILAVTSRLWLTVLEIIPGIIALAFSQTKFRTRHA